MNEDPARLFFPEGDVDLYEVLGLSRAENPSEEAIRKAYRKRALQSHPDKAHLRGKEAADQAAHAFQQVGFAYSVLSDPDRRKRYDRTGSTSDSIFEDGDIDWNAYFQTLWDGEVNADTLEEFKQKYQGSEEERQDLLQAYRDTKGSLEGIFATVPCSNILVDEKRFIALINEAVRAKEVPKTKSWEWIRSDEGKRARKSLKAKARSEAAEAEAYAKELGLYDTVYKKDEAPAQDDQGDLDMLRAAMQNKAKKRESAFDDMIQRLEQEHTAKSPNRKRARKAPTGRP